MWTQSPKFPRSKSETLRNSKMIPYFRGENQKDDTRLYVLKLVKNKKLWQGYVTSSAFKLDLTARHININVHLLARKSAMFD